MNKLLIPLAALACATPLFAELDPAIETRVDALLAQMTLDEKLGQMMMVQQTFITTEQITSEFVGSILMGASQNHWEGVTTVDEWANHYDAMQQAALDTRLGIPLIIGGDMIHGAAFVPGATVFPHNMGLASTPDPDLMERLGQVTARETAAVGIDWILGPTVAVVRDPRWGRSYEGWGEHPEAFAGLVAAFIRGVQTPYNGADAIGTTAKHYLADGGAAWGTGPRGAFSIDQGDVTVPEQELRRLHLPPYVEAVQEKSASIMVSYGSWQGDELHGQAYLLTDLLKNEVGFEGFIVSDYNGFSDLDEDYGESVVLACIAGIDLFMMNENWTVFKPALTNAIPERVPMSRIDDAVRRILRVKAELGILDNPLTDRAMTDGGVVGSAEHRAIAREAVRKSQVLLKNEGDLLPLPKNVRLLVAGGHADDIGRQCGGWTIEWGGVTGPAAEQALSGTTILEGIRALVEPAGGTVAYESRARYEEEFDVGVVIIGEDPTAEWLGDSRSLPIKSADREALSNMVALGKPFVVCVVSGRPIILEGVEDWPAVVASWYIGTEGLGVAETLFGDYPYSGRTPITWPKTADQLPMNADGNPFTYDPLFALGDGLDTAFSVLWLPLPAGRPGESYSVRFDAVLAEGEAVFRLADGELPDGLGLTSGGVLSGELSTSTTGIYTFTLEAQDDAGTARREFTLDSDRIATSFGLSEGYTLTEGTYEGTWLGAFRGLEYPWIRQAELGWLYAGSEPAGWFYAINFNNGWYYTNANSFPWLYELRSGEWLYFLGVDETTYRFWSEPRGYFTYGG